MLTTTCGQILVNNALPEDMRDYNRVFDGPAQKKVLQELALKHPDKYRETLQKLMLIGRDVSYATGGFSFGLDDLRVPAAAKASRARLNRRMQDILAGGWSPAERDEKILAAASAEHERLMSEVVDELKKNKNPLAHQIASGARGNAAQLKRLVAGDLLYVDHHDNPIPLPIQRSYSEGLGPVEYWAATFGARKGLADVKVATQDAGFFAKQLAQVAHRLMVTDIDDDAPPSTTRGYPTSVDDPDNEGALLAVATGGYPRNTVLTPKILSELSHGGVRRILVRSPIVGGPHSGGLYARDAGLDENGQLTPLGTIAGLTAAQALSEKLTQGQLCLAVGTQIRMADWTVRHIEEVEEGAWVLGADKTGRVFPVQVLRVHDNGVRECVRTRFREAKTQQHVELISTAEHKVLAKTRHWALPSERTEYGVFPVTAKCVGYSAKMTSSVEHACGYAEPFAALCGLLLGDGCYTVSVHGIYWSCYEPSLVDAMQPYLTSIGLVAAKLQGHKGYYRISQLVDTVNQCEVTGRLLPGDRHPYLIWLKQRQMYGKYAHEKIMPDDVWSWDRASVQALLGCLYATDGSVYPATDAPDTLYVNFASTSLPLAAAVKELLRVRFAIHGSAIGMSRSGRKRPLYKFDITRKEQVRRFATQIAIPDRKGQMLTDYVAGWTPDDRAEYYHRQQQEPVGALPTYDLEVDHPDHLFVLANGLIVSNSSKHAGGVKGQAKAVSGFQAINQLAQIPKTFRGAATHAQLDGRVNAVQDAPGGGWNVMVDGEPHFVDTEFKPIVKVGDTVEAGDVLSTGIPHPAEVTKHKHVGEGRRYWVDAFRAAYGAGGMPKHRRNIEMIARALINHVEMTDVTDDNVPGDIMQYQQLERNWTPRQGSQTLTPKQAVGKYLEAPVLHHTIGTKIRPSMLKDFDEFGIKQLVVHDDEPPFRPVMIRALDSLASDPDWQVRFLGGNQKRNLLDAVHRGSVSDTAGSSFVPALVEGVGFGKTWPQSALGKG